MQTQNRSVMAGGALAAALLAAPLARPDAIALWHFDEPPGSRTAYDSVGNHHGTLFGSADFVPGGVSLNAVAVTKAGNGFVSMGNYFPFTTGDFTVVAWVQTEPGDQRPYRFVAKQSYGSPSGYLLGVNSSDGFGGPDKAWLYISTSPGGAPVSTTSVNDGLWHQVVGVYRAGVKAKIYVDGAPPEDSKLTAAIGASAAAFVVGGQDGPSGPFSFFDGRVDEVQLYDHLLTDRQIQYLFEHPARTVIGALGDLNCDLVVNNFDIDPFVLALTNPDEYKRQFPNCNILHADVNGDGAVNNFDIDPFVLLITGD